MSLVMRSRPRIALAGLAAALAWVHASQARIDRPTPDPAGGGSFPVAIRIDASKPQGEMRPVWRFFGHDEPNYTYMEDGKKLLGQLAALSPEPVYIRTHNLLTSGDGTPALKWGSTGVYSEDAEGKPRYDWTILDRIFDTYKERGVRPFVQIGFMPEALSTHPQPYQHRWTPGGKESISTGWAYPPKDYEKWAELVFQWVEHSVERYGQAEVEAWYWEVWNEPNILYWRGTPEEYHKTYDYAVDAVKRALPTARVGGPHVAGTKSPEATKFLRDFLEHCLRGKNHATGEVGLAAGLRGLPRQGGAPVRRRARPDGDRRPASGHRPGLRGRRQLPRAEGQADHHRRERPGRLRRLPRRRSTRRTATATGRSTPATPPPRSPASTPWPSEHGVNFEGAVTWAFEFEGQPYFAGFRVLSTNGVAAAGAERLPHVRPDGGRAAGRGERRRGRAGGDPQGRRAGQAGRLGPGEPAGRQGLRPGLAPPRRRRAGAGSRTSSCR